MQPMLRRFPHQIGAELIRDDQPSILGKISGGTSIVSREQQAIAMQPVVLPFLIGTEVGDWMI